jgi:anaerobic selenocysteine-containing dehydrogenase
LEVTVQNGKVMKVDGDKAHPESKGAQCPKCRAPIEILYLPDRRTYPMKRVKLAAL